MDACHTYWRRLVSGGRTDLIDTFAKLLLTPFACLYSSALRQRGGLYRAGVFKTYRLPRPVVSIGNITVGGTGKTPVTAHCANFLIEQGYRVAVISRGYGGSLEGHTCVVSDGTTIMLSPRECGDEPYLLASTVPGLMVVIGTDRYAAGMLAMQQLSPDVFLLDDGFQHLRLHRDLNILLLDYARPFGNGLTLPAGMLREPESAADRADLVILTRAPEGAAIADETSKIPTSLAHHTIADLMPLKGGEPVTFSACSNLKALAFAGIADPDSFFEGVRGKGVNLVRCLSFPDHAVYNSERCDEIAAEMRSSGAEILVTTEKDGVKLELLSEKYAAVTYLARLKLSFSDPDILHEMLSRYLIPVH